MEENCLPALTTKIFITSHTFQTTIPIKFIITKTARIIPYYNVLYDEYNDENDTD